jgi:hypothetical protein
VSKRTRRILAMLGLLGQSSLVVMKLTHMITWSWWAVLSPTMIPGMITLIVQEIATIMESED